LLQFDESLVRWTQLILQKYLAGVRPPKKIINRIMFLRQGSEKSGYAIVERLEAATELRNIREKHDIANIELECLLHRVRQICACENFLRHFCVSVIVRITPTAFANERPKVICLTAR